ncbi:MAG: leucine-rich repeat domain-containing protein [Kiritimatiellae bacterium]|nr:leucine-rich repeat domain-containing protein [Kiritimatiellia bacterium]
MKRTLMVALALAAAGCFNEPTPATVTVPEGARLYLQDRALRDLSSCRELLKPELVDYVNLDRNELEEFPAELSTLTGLKWLRLNRNKLSSLKDVSPLVNLRRIYLKGNRFTSVPEELKALPALTDVDLSQNPITEVPDWFVAKRGLENVSFSETLLKKLPDDLSGWENLTSLQLGGLRLAPDEMARIRRALPKVTIVF